MHVNDAQEEVAQTIKNYGFLAIPVVDDTNTLVGIITVDDRWMLSKKRQPATIPGLAGVNVDKRTKACRRGLLICQEL